MVKPKEKISPFTLIGLFASVVVWCFMNAYFYVIMALTILALSESLRSSIWFGLVVIWVLALVSVIKITAKFVKYCNRQHAKFKEQ